MQNTTLFERIPELKEKLTSLVVHKKKLRALENYSEVNYFQHNDYLGLIKKCLNDGFLDDRESEFLTYMIQKYDVNFLDWSHRTKWLKEEMDRLASLAFHMEQHEQMKKYQAISYSKITHMTPANAAFDMVARQHVAQHSCRV